MDILQKYNLPKKVEVSLSEAREGGFVVEFPKLPGCYTQASSLVELDSQVTDAVLTYFDVPRSEAKKLAYLPETKIVSSKPKVSLSEAQFDLYIAA